MSLKNATFQGQPLGLPGEPPYDTELLVPLMGKRFELPCDDNWVKDTGTRAHLYLDGAKSAWGEHPDWMDFLDLDSPINALKRAERDLYLHHWEPWLNAKRVLDVGCGIGRFTTAFLDYGADVVGVDADIKALVRCAWHAANRPGRIDLHWSTVHNLPDVGEFDVVIAAEVLCYVPDVRRALAAIVDRLRPGGTLLIAMEARYGWACAEDAPQGALAHALTGDGVIHIPGDRWVRTWTREDLWSLLNEAGLHVERMVPMLYIMDGPLEPVMPESLSLEEIIDAEDRCRKHPVWGPLNRIWTAAATKPD